MLDRTYVDTTAEDLRLGRKLRRKAQARRVVGILLSIGVTAAIAYFAYPEVKNLFVTEVTADENALEEGVPSKAIAATVVSVHDGDTLHISTSTDDDVTVRLIGLDTPEVGDNLECFGDEATVILEKLAPVGSTVWALADGGTEDKYGRSLFYLFTDEGVLINVELVRRGAGETLLISNNDRYWDELEAAEVEARDGARGVWGDC